MKSLLAVLSICLLLSAANAAGRNWTLSGVDGDEFSISKNAGNRPSLLVFWATWCKPCKSELDAMKDTFNDLNKRGVNVIIIAEDNVKSKSRVKPYIESKGFEWTALLDPDGEVLKLYGGTSIPFSVLLDASGAPVYENRGEMKDATAMLNKANQLIESAGE